MLSRIRIVLIGTTHPGNIGAVARAMKNMCLEQLVLVAPKIYPSAEATARASGADDLLGSARVCDSLDQALAGCRLVVGTSARLRSVRWPQVDPRQCAERLLDELSADGEVAVLFGRESSGLSNTELDRCHYLVHIPANPDYASLNLAQAAQVIGYELRMAAKHRGEQRGLATRASRIDIGPFFDKKLSRFLLSVGGGEVQRSIAALVHCVDIGTVGY